MVSSSPPPDKAEESDPNPNPNPKKSSSEVSAASPSVVAASAAGGATHLRLLPAAQTRSPQQEAGRSAFSAPHDRERSPSAAHNSSVWARRTT